VVLAAACARPSPWDHLAESYAPPAPQAGARPAAMQHADGTPGRWTLRDDPSGAGWWLEIEYVASDWTAGPLAGLWIAARGVRALGLPPAKAAAETFEVEGLDLRHVRVADAVMEAASLRPGDWTAPSQVIALFTGGAAPASARSAVWVPRGRRENGAWRIEVPGTAAEGFVLPVGADIALWGRRAGPSTLRFGVEAYAVAAEAAQTIPARLEVWVDGVLAHDYSVPIVPAPRPERVALDLPAGRKTVAIEFRARGPAAVLAVTSPVIGPRDIGTRGTRPKELLPKRPDIILFVADTLRADALSAYRDQPSAPPAEVTPILDAFGRGATLFERAWSPSPWTLPSHATLFTGLAPEQHGTLREELQLPRDLTTVAERLRVAGYRTESTADTGFLEPVFGLDQGFEVYLTRQTHVADQSRSLPNLLAMTQRAIDADDGRPLFLFAHTFRVHAPYYVTPETAAQFALPPEFTTGWSDFQTRVNSAFPKALELRSGVDPDKLMARFGDEMRWRYYGGVHDLDRGFGELLKQIERSGMATDTTVIFTSDHGEAFGELGQMLHGEGLHDGVTRIPLIVRGPRFGARIDRRSASLADVALTVLELAGESTVSPGPGRSLLQQAADRPVYQSMHYGTTRWAVVDWPHRYLWDEHGARILTEFSDSASERRIDPIPEAEEPRFVHHRTRTRGLLERFERGPVGVEVTEEVLVRLQNMGYVGE